MKINPDGSLDYTGFELENPPRYHPYEWEIVQDWKGWVGWTHTHWTIPLWTGLVYIVTIFGIQAAMKNREAFVLKRQLFLWNAALGLFSILGFIRMAPEFFGMIYNSGFYNSVCIW